MEGFEQFVAVALETEGFVVSPAVKFPVKRPTKRSDQTHGYEVDLVGARSDRLVLATVKSFFGSRGVVSEHVMGRGANRSHNNHYLMLNDSTVRDGVIRVECERYGYRRSQVQIRLYVGKFAGAKTGTHEAVIRDWCKRQRVGGGCIEVVDVRHVVASVLRASEGRQYRNNPVVVAMRVLKAAGVLTAGLAADSLGDLDL